MKSSRFNRIFQADDGVWLAFNSWSTALAELKPEDLPFIRAMLADPAATPCDTPEKRHIREALVQGHFLVEDDEDEIATLKTDMMTDRFRTDMLGLTIAPTLDCNFRCDYCYEEHLRVTMSRTVQQALLRWVEKKAPLLETMHVTWFGGEPMIPNAFAVVEDVSRGFIDMAKAGGFNYASEIVTNGYFLSRAKVELLKELGIGKIQVTLDGPPVIHDRRRVLLGGQGTFWKIIDNLKEIAGMMYIQLRINVDRRNAGATLELIELLQKEGLADKIHPYLAQVTFDGAACGNILESCFSSDEFAKTEVGIYAEAAARGLPLSKYPFRIKGAFCTADRVNGFVIAPSGSIFKCWHEVTVAPDKAVDHLLDGKQAFHKVNESKWLGWNTLEKEECPTCTVLPLCHGGCPLEAMKVADSPHGACEQSKFNLEPLLTIQHKHRPKASSTPVARGGVGVTC